MSETTEGYEAEIIVDPAFFDATVQDEPTTTSASAEPSLVREAVRDGVAGVVASAITMVGTAALIVGVAKGAERVQDFRINRAKKKIAKLEEVVALSEEPTE